MPDTVKLFYGFDPRESVGAHVFLQSVLDNTNLPVEAVALTPAIGDALGIKSEGTNSFGKIRFCVPWLCDFKGYAIFMDGADQILRADIGELWNLRNGWDAVQVVKHSYKTRHTRKYIGTDLEADNQDYERKNWSSVAIWNCSHYMNRQLTPNFIRDQPSANLHRFKWLQDERIGELPAEWNYIVDEPNQAATAKLVHFSIGIPGFKRYAEVEFAEEWRASHLAATRGMQTEASER